MKGIKVDIDGELWRVLWKEVIEDVKNVRFKEYYKYLFTYVGEGSRFKVTIRYGGNAERIYKWNFYQEHELEDGRDDQICCDMEIVDKEQGVKYIYDNWDYVY